MYLILKKRTVAVIISCCLLLCLTVVIVSGVNSERAVTVSAAADNWGLSFRSDDGIPTGNVSVEELSRYNGLYLGDTQKKTIYLTFDAGYENGYTSQILQTLKKHNVKATFFLVGNYIETSPELVKQMIMEGHTVGNHTMTHPDMGAISDKASFARELENLEGLYKSVTGQTMKKIYRPPQGKYSEENLEMAKSLGYHTVFWSLAYVDWNNDSQPTREEAFDKLIPRIHNGAIVLLHSTSKTNCEILDELLTKWEQMGYSFGSLTDLIDDA